MEKGENIIKMENVSILEILLMENMKDLENIYIKMVCIIQDFGKKV